MRRNFGLFVILIAFGILVAFNIIMYLTDHNDGIDHDTSNISFAGTKESFDPSQAYNVLLGCSFKIECPKILYNGRNLNITRETRFVEDGERIAFVFFDGTQKVGELVFEDEDSGIEMDSSTGYLGTYGDENEVDIPESQLDKVALGVFGIPNYTSRPEYLMAVVNEGLEDLKHKKPKSAKKTKTTTKPVTSTVTVAKPATAVSTKTVTTGTASTTVAKSAATIDKNTKSTTPTSGGSLSKSTSSRSSSSGTTSNKKK